MNQTIGIGWYCKKCVLGALTGLAVELALLALEAAAIQNGAIGESGIGVAAAAAAALAAFAGCVAAGVKTGRRTEMVLSCAALLWVLAQLLGFILFDALQPARSLTLAAAVTLGALGALLLGGKGKKKRKGRSIARRRR